MPHNVSEQWSFLGLAPYYQRFIRDFATIASPLHCLTEKGQVFWWNEDCAHAFSKLRSAFVEAPLLAYHDPQWPFIVDTDASNIELSAVLSQEASARRTSHGLPQAPAASCLECIDPAKLRHDLSSDPVLSRVQGWVEGYQRPAWSAVSALNPETKALYSQWSSLISRDGLFCRCWQAWGAMTSSSSWSRASSGHKSSSSSIAQWGWATLESPRLSSAFNSSSTGRGVIKMWSFMFNVVTPVRPRWG